MTATEATAQIRLPGHRGVAVPALLMILAAVTALLVIADVRSPLRALVVAVFVLVAPGWAALDRWDLAHDWLGATLVVAISTSLTTCLVLIQLYTLTWSPRTALGLLLVAVFAGELVELIRRLRANPEGIR